VLFLLVTNNRTIYDLQNTYFSAGIYINKSQNYQHLLPPSYSHYTQ